MDYEKKYNEAQKWIESIYTELSHEQQMEAEAFFPELKESEDERIRKEIIATIHLYYGEPLEDEAKEMIAWLEKQEGCEYIKKDWLEHIKQSWYKEGFIDGKYSGETSKEWTINDDATLKELIDFLENGTAKLQHDLTKYANWLKIQFTPIEKQGEQKSIDNLTQQEAMDIAVAKCFNEGEQKLADKVEPKFQNGQWIVWQNKCYKVNYNGCGYELIDQNGLSTSLEYGTVDKTAHLWSIHQDAKDGDVLACPLPKGYETKEQIFIFKSINSRDYVDNCIEYYCRICEGVFYENENGYMGTTSSPIYPATKEQRDQLEKAMADAGYIWDSKSKRLLSLKAGLNYTQNPAWSEEDMSKVQRICMYLDEAKKYYADITEVRECIDWLKSLKDRVQPKQEWSEEDEEFLRRAINVAKDKYPMTANWLKSLKQRIGWKPSAGQMKALHDLNLTGNISYAGQGQILIELYNDLKKLTE